MKTRFLLWIAGVVGLSALAQTYSIRWSKIAGGGGVSTNGAFTVVGTIGQHDADGSSTNAVYAVTGGFWALPVAVQTIGAPVLSVAPGAPGEAVVSWTPSSPGFVLQEASELAATNWVNAPSGALNPATVPAGAPAKFYRLHKP